jgi:hypothetical protein
MDLSGLTSVTTKTEMLAWLASNLITPVSPAISGSDLGIIMQKLLQVTEGTDAEPVLFDTKSTNYTLQLTDSAIDMGMAAANTITIPNNTDAPFPVIGEDTTSMSILVVDLYANATLNVIGLIDNAEVAESHIAAYTGSNFIPAGAVAAEALILASDFIDQSVLNWSFEFNLHKLKLQYPSTDQFRIFIMGRASGVEPISLNGAYVVYNPQGTMVMNNSPGTYQPSVTGGTH